MSEHDQLREDREVAWYLMQLAASPSQPSSPTCSSQSPPLSPLIVTAVDNPRKKEDDSNSDDPLSPLIVTTHDPPQVRAPVKDEVPKKHVILRDAKYLCARRSKRQRRLSAPKIAWRKKKHRDIKALVQRATILLDLA